MIVAADRIIAEMPVGANKTALSGKHEWALKVFVKYAPHVLIDIDLPTPAPPVINKFSRFTIFGRTQLLYFTLSVAKSAATLNLARCFKLRESVKLST